MCGYIHFKQIELHFDKTLGCKIHNVGTIFSKQTHTHTRTQHTHAHYESYNALVKNISL